MFKRQMEDELRQAAVDYQVVTVVGPRQSGKTTLVRSLFPGKPYVNLEELDVQQMARSDPRGFLATYPEGAVLDEIQRVPELLSYIQVRVDERGKKGEFILTGSHQVALHQAISQSLAGRTALLSLLPMSMAELTRAGFDFSLDEWLVRGGYPRIFKDDLNPTKAYRNYFQTYIERDLRQLIQVKNLSQFQRFVQLCAGRIGQILNLESLGNDVGVSSHTVKEWISILEASYVIFRIHPYFENFGKRKIKAPKLYFTDVGFAAYVLGIENRQQMERDPLKGNLFENLIALEIVKWRCNQGLDPHLYFFRDAKGHEVDFIFRRGNELIPIEVKAGSTFNQAFLKNLSFFSKLVGERMSEGIVAYGGNMEQSVGSFHVVNYKNVALRLSEGFS